MAAVTTLSAALWLALARGQADRIGRLQSLQEGDALSERMPLDDDDNIAVAMRGSAPSVSRRTGWLSHQCGRAQELASLDATARSLPYQRQ